MLLGEAQGKEAVFSNTFLHCPQWSFMDSCQANLGQRLTLDQVPEITGPGHFLWVKGISPESWNTDLESVTRLSCPHDDLKKHFSAFWIFTHISWEKNEWSCWPWDFQYHRVAWSTDWKFDFFFLRSVRLSTCSFWKECDLQAHK